MAARTRMPAHVTPRRVESRIPRMRPPIMAASWRAEGAPREIETEDDEERAGHARRAGNPRARTASPAVHQLDEDREPRENPEAHAEREAAGPGRGGHEQA